MRTKLLLTSIAALFLATGAAQTGEVKLPKDMLDGATRKTVIRHDNGGVLHEYIERWSNISVQGGQVEVLGRCVSACTLVTAYIPKDRICFGPDASLDFHQAYIIKPEFGPATEATKWMLEKYPADIRRWIADQGRYRMHLDWNVSQGSETPPLYGFWTLPAEELWKMGYRKCGE